MNKYIKYSASVIISLSLFLGVLVYAEENEVKTTLEIKNDGDKVEVEDKTEIEKPSEAEKTQAEKIREDLKNRREESKKSVEVKREEAKQIREGTKDALEANREEFKTKLETMIGDIKIKREEFKKELDGNKELVKQKMEAAREEFKAGLEKIKDEKKKIATEKIVTSVVDLNVIITGKFGVKIDQIEAVLISIQSRIDKAETNGIDVSTSKAQVLKAQAAIEVARTAISTQSAKTYETTINEATLKTDMKKLRDTFRADLKIVNDKVKLAHQAVRDTATTLAKVPKIDDDTTAEVETETEVKTTN